MLHVHQLWRQDGADGSWINRSVSVAAGLTVDRAGVHAGGAANALERLALLGARKNRRAAIVEQNDMEVLRAVAGCHAGPERGVGVHALACGRTGQHLEHDFKVLKARQHLLNAGQGDHGAGQREAHAAVALRLHNGNRTGFGDEEIRPADGRGDGQKLLPQIPAGRGGQGLRIVRQIFQAHAAGENFAHLAAIDVQRRDDDVGGFFIA